MVGAAQGSRGNAVSVAAIGAIATSPLDRDEARSAAPGAVGVLAIVADGGIGGAPFAGRLGQSVAWSWDRGKEDGHATVRRVVRALHGDLARDPSHRIPGVLATGIQAIFAGSRRAVFSPAAIAYTAFLENLVFGWSGGSRSSFGNVPGEAALKARCGVFLDHALLHGLVD